PRSMFLGIPVGHARCRCYPGQVFCMNDRRDAWGRAGKGAPFEQPRIIGCNKGNEMEDRAMSLIRKNGYAVSTRGGFSGTLFSALMALALFDPGVANAQEVKQIKLTEKHIQSFMGVYREVVKLYESANPARP